MASMSTPGGSCDNPIPINVTAMVDIIFCLCIFFMCSFHFRQVETSLDSWLPAHGRLDERPAPVVLEEIRLFLDIPDGRTVRRAIGSRPVGSDLELGEALRAIASENRRAGLGAVPVVIDSAAGVPWREVVLALEICRGEDLGKIEFAAPRTGTGTGTGTGKKSAI